MSNFNPRTFLIQPKRTRLAFIIFYVFFMIILALITRSVGIKFCTSCGLDVIATLLYYLLSLGLMYFLFCWTIYMWKKAWKQA